MVDKKSKLFFVDEKHRRNYEALTEKFPAANRNGEYAAACYIVAHPEVFKGIQIEELEHGAYFCKHLNYEEAEGENNAQKVRCG